MISVDDIRFDYVKIVANHFFPEIHTESSPMRIVHFASRVPDVFCDALNNGEISASPSDAFLSDMSLQDMIKARQLDPEKLWLLCVWMKHLLNCSVEVMGPPTIREISYLSSAINSITDNQDFELSLTVGKEKRISIKRFPVLATLGDILKIGKTEFENNPQKYGYVDSYPEKEISNKALGFFFYEYLIFFLKDKKPVKGTGTLETKDTKFFIGKLFFAVGLSDDDRFNQYWAEADEDDREIHELHFYNGILSGAKTDFKNRRFWSEHYQLWLTH